MIAAIEAKSQVEPSFGNNFNNRTEEAMGTALDIWPAFREGAFNGGDTMESVDQLAKKAIGLRPIDRILLVEAILYSLDKPDPDVEKCWAAESEARYDAYKRGELEAVEG